MGSGGIDDFFFFLGEARIGKTFHKWELDLKTCPLHTSSSLARFRMLDLKLCCELPTISALDLSSLFVCII